jgi:hypothetical protein
MLLFILYDVPLHSKFKNYSSERFRKAQLPRSFLIVMIFSIGAKRSCVETIKTIKNIRWNFDGQFKDLGIKYDLNKAEFWADNFKEKIITIKKLLGNWALRNLSLL